MPTINKQGLSAKVIKALGLFGSLEMLKMLCAVIRTKLVAIWIGTVGVGVITLYSSTMEMIKSIAMLNLRQSGVPAIVSAKDNPEKQAHVIGSLDLICLIIGIISTLLLIIFSPLLSKLTFGSYDYAWGFALLAPTMLASTVSDARQAVLQGLGRLRELALASLYAVVAATVVALPLFYFFRMAAIVPVLIIFPVFTAFFLYLPLAKTIKRPSHNSALFRHTVRALIKLGSFLTLGIAIGLVADYALRAWLARVGGVDAVGVFQAGYTIVKNYVGLFFTAITMEFFPRLSATINHRRYTSLIVAHEINLSVRLLIPVIVIFIFCNDWIVRLLYSSSFFEAIPYITIAIIATSLRAASWCFSYVIVAKGDGSLYLVTEGISAISLLVFSYLGWTYGGYAGLGWAFLGQYVLFTAATWIACRVKYGLRMPPSVGISILAALVIGLIALYVRTLI